MSTKSILHSPRRSEGGSVSGHPQMRRRASLRRVNSLLSPRPSKRMPSDVVDMRIQFGEQLKSLEQRSEAQVALLAEVQDYFRRRAEIELEYSKGLEKLAKSMSGKVNKGEKPKYETWQQLSLYTFWQDLVQHTKVEGRQRAAFSDVCGNYVITRMNNQSDAIQRISKKCREIAMEAQQEILRVLNELHTAMKTYQVCHGESCNAEGKFKAIEVQKLKFEESHPKKKGSRKHRIIQREFDKKYSKYQENKLKSLMARNEYLLCVDAANAALRKYFADGISDILDCTDLGLRQWLQTTVSAVTLATQCLLDSGQVAQSSMNTWMEALDPRQDKQRFLESNHALFSLPKKLEFHAHKTDEVRQVSAQKAVQDDLMKRYSDLTSRLTHLRTETEEIWKTLESAERTLLRKVRLPEAKIEESFRQAASTDASNSGGPVTRRTSVKDSSADVHADAQKLKQEVCEMEDFYHKKFREYCLTSNLIERLSARHAAIQSSLGIVPSTSSSPTHYLLVNGRSVTPPSLDDESQASIDLLNYYSASAMAGGVGDELDNRPPSVPPKPRKKRIGRSTGVIAPKLFGGTIEEYAELTGQEVPLIIRSCIRMLSMYGLHHQGVFRQSGSLPEINKFKDAFERGEDPLVDVFGLGDDPLVDVTGKSDVNAVAGVLKMYFRELREPLFPIYVFDQFMEYGDVVTEATKDTFVENVRALVQSLPRPVFVVMRYLFAFLNHLSEFSDENMMDPFNIAVCFGPTIMRVPESRDQSNYTRVNFLICNMIRHQDDIFVHDGGITYEKYLLTDQAYNDGVNEIMPTSDDEAECPGIAGSDDDLATGATNYNCLAAPNDLGFESQSDAEISAVIDSQRASVNSEPARAPPVGSEDPPNRSSAPSGRPPDGAPLVDYDDSAAHRNHHHHHRQPQHHHPRPIYETSNPQQHQRLAHPPPSATFSEVPSQQYANLVRPTSMSSVQHPYSPASGDAHPVWQRRQMSSEDDYTEKMVISKHSSFKRSRGPLVPHAISVEAPVSPEDPSLITYAHYKNNSAMLQSARFSRSLASPYLRLGVVGYPVSSCDKSVMQSDGHGGGNLDSRQRPPPPDYNMATSLILDGNRPSHLDPATNAGQGHVNGQWKRGSTGSYKTAMDSGLAERPASMDSTYGLPRGPDAPSPNTLRDIQVELKAVLSSLETFNKTRPETQRASSISPFPTDDSGHAAPPPPAPMSWTKNYTPDLVQNLPQTTVDTASPSGSPPKDTGHPLASTPPSFAECFAEPSSSTIRKPTAAIHSSQQLSTTEAAVEEPLETMSDSELVKPVPPRRASIEEHRDSKNSPDAERGPKPASRNVSTESTKSTGGSGASNKPVLRPKPTLPKKPSGTGSPTPVRRQMSTDLKEITKM